MKKTLLFTLLFISNFGISQNASCDIITAITNTNGQVLEGGNWRNAALVIKQKTSGGDIELLNSLSPNGSTINFNYNYASGEQLYFDYTPLTATTGGVMPDSVNAFVLNNCTATVNGAVIIFPQYRSDVDPDDYNLNVNMLMDNYMTFEMNNNMDISLPIDLISFDLLKNERYIVCNWRAIETDFDYYMLEKSKDGITFENYQKMESIGNNSNEAVSYHVFDTAPFYNGYYRLKMVDLDGSFQYSEIRYISFDKDLTIKVFPNPSSDFINVDIDGSIDNLNLLLFDSNGNLLGSEKITQPCTKKEISNLSPGNYYLKLSPSKQPAIKFIKL